jgi:carbonic anhydrase
VPLPPLESFRRLRDGNQRFVANLRQQENMHLSEGDRAALARSQEPHAIILGCSDSRAPAELIFDQGLGDLFVIRVAGNIVAPSQIGSVEFAAAQFNTRLVVVLGHSQCGAVTSSLAHLKSGSPNPSPNIRFIVSRVSKAIAPLLASGPSEPEALLAAAVRANVRASCSRLRNGSVVLERLIRQEGLVVIGADYSIATGAVDFFDGVPEGWGEGQASTRKQGRRRAVATAGPAGSGKIGR